MSIIDFEEEEKKRRGMEYPKLRAIQGGKEPPSHVDHWLNDLEQHAVFIARERKNAVTWLASEYHLVSKNGNAFFMCLKQWDPEKGRERIHYSWFDGPQFSQEWICVEVLDDGKNYPEIEDGQGNRTDNETRLEGDVGVPPDSIMDKDTRQEVIRGESEDEPNNIK